MINNTKKIKELYENIQRKLFNIVPGKWDELYLYASIIERLGKVQVGEMYFYFMPRGILKRKFINVYSSLNFIFLYPISLINFNGSNMARYSRFYEFIIIFVVKLIN